MKLSVIVPAYNEAKNLLVNITKFYHYLKDQNYDFEIIIVNDGSTDKTGDLAELLCSRLINLKLIEHKINMGKGAAIRTGLLAATGDYRLFIDADNATSIEHIEKLWPLFDQSYEIVIGTRNKSDATGAYQARPQKLWKRILGILGNIVIRILAVHNIKDTQCGFKAFTKKAVNEIIPKTKINRWAIDVEILLIADRLNYKIGKIPVVWLNCQNSRVKLKDYFLFIKDLLLIKFGLLTGKYKINQTDISAN
jgi:dolichyl-phosphate beta-glucosyltransferase